MNNILTRLIGDKKDWKRMEARATDLPADYRSVYAEMKNYVWRFTSSDGMDNVAILRDILDLFETEAAAGRILRRPTARAARRLPHQAQRGRPEAVVTSENVRAPLASRVTSGARTMLPYHQRGCHPFSENSAEFCIAEFWGSSGSGQRTDPTSFATMLSMARSATAAMVIEGLQAPVVPGMRAPSRT
jgi:hypothetical protein